MQANALNAKLKVFQERYKALEADYLSVNQQIMQTRDAADRNKLQRQADDLFQEMLAAEKQLNQSNLSTITYDTHYKRWQEDLPKINFSNLDRILNLVSEKVFTEGGGAVFFLIQNYHSMGGKWCVEKIKSSLKDKGVWSYLNVGFAIHEQPNQSEFLRRLGASFGIEVNDNNWEHSTQIIIDKIYSSLQTNNTVFIEVKIVSLGNKTIFLDWMIRDFWLPLISGLSSISQKLPFIKFITVLTVDVPISREFISASIFCDPRIFSSQKIFEIELSNWTELEIISWLYDFSGLANLSWTRADFETMAKTLYQATQGRPIDVHNLLVQELTQIFNKC